MSNATLGDRMKHYEKVFMHLLTPRMPVIIRIDGRAFHTFTREMNKPFDASMMNAMKETMMATAKEMQGFKAAYTQSDEISFLITDYDNIESQGWFNYELNKIVSTTSAIASVVFSKNIDTQKFIPTFDARAFNVPREDVANYFLWRAKDWQRNSLQMYARVFFSNKELYQKGHNEIHEMLHKLGKNWTTDLSEAEKNGTWFFKHQDVKMLIDSILPNFSCVNQIIDPLITLKSEDHDGEE